MPSLYQLKPGFQRLLRPLVRALARSGVTANAVTIGSALGSLAVGGVLYGHDGGRQVFLLLPAWLLLRMAANAVDGMLARERGETSRLGLLLNELGDVVSDAALYLPLATVAPFRWEWVSVVVLLAALTEMAGVLGQAGGPGRRHDGPMGKSDRALAFGLVGLWIGCSTELPAMAAWIMPVLAFALVATLVNRVRAQLAG